MKTTITNFIEILADDGKELYNEKLNVSTNRVTSPLGTDLSNWVEREIEEESKTDNQWE